MNKTVFLVYTEDNSFIGVTPDLRTAKRLAREEFSCRYDRADLNFEEDWDEFDSQRYWVAGCFDNPKLPIMLIAEIPFFDRGTRFPIDLSDPLAEIPNFLRRQAD